MSEEEIRRRKNRKTRLSPLQYRLLEEEYSKKKKWETQEIDDLAEILGVHRQRVSKWNWDRNRKPDGMFPKV